MRLHSFLILSAVLISSFASASEIRFERITAVEDVTVVSFSGVRFDAFNSGYFCRDKTKNFKIKSDEESGWSARVRFSPRDGGSCRELEDASLILERPNPASDSSGLVYIDIVFDKNAPKKIVYKDLKLDCKTVPNHSYRQVFACPDFTMHPEGSLRVDGLHVTWTLN